MKAVLPYVLLMTGTLAGAIAIICAVYFFRPQLLGVAPKPAQPAALRDTLRTKSPLPPQPVAQKTDSVEVKSDSTVRGAPSPVTGKEDRASLLDSIRTLAVRVDEQRKMIEQLTAKGPGHAGSDSTGMHAGSDSTRAKDSKSFAKMIETMPAEQAVRILKGLDDREVKAVLLSVKKRQAAKILSALDPERAARMMRTMQ